MLDTLIQTVQRALRFYRKLILNKNRTITKSQLEMNMREHIKKEKWLIKTKDLLPILKEVII